MDEEEFQFHIQILVHFFNMELDLQPILLPLELVKILQSIF